MTSTDSEGIPNTSAREAETTTIVKNGETVAIGGLIREEDIRTIQSVPLLSRLPIVGELFKNRLKSHKHNDIIVTITPQLVEEEREPAKP